MTDTKVIMVDDKKSTLSSIAQILNGNGFSVASCAGGFEALAKLADDGADLVFASTDLSDISGYQLSCLIKCNERTQLLPVALVKPDINGQEKFWSAGALADTLLDLKDLKNSKKIVSVSRSLVERAHQLGWKASMARESSAALPRSKDPLDNFRAVVDGLLNARLINCLTRAMMDVTSPRKKFLDQYFALVSPLFNCQMAGILLANSTHPWAGFQLASGLAKKSFDDLIKKLSRDIDNAGDLQLDVRGSLEDTGGKPLGTPEILFVKADKMTLGALIFSCSDKNGFDQASKAAMLELQSQMSPVFRLLQANQEIEQLKQQEQYRVSTDALTGLYNLEFLVGFLQQQLLFSFRQRSPVGLIIVDIDHLQRINDEFGYEIGDLVLSTMANRLLNLTRSSDLLARYGGDEFAVVLPNTDVNGARVLAEKIRLAVEQMSFVKGSGHKGPRVTVSIGCAGFNMEDLNPETILRDCKMALKRAKQLGANQVSL